jgi:hypothetical protein
VNIVEAINDPGLFAPWFKNPETWEAWRAFLAGLFGLPMKDRKQRRIFEECTGRKPPRKPMKEGWLVVGRRGGKSFISALVAVYLACFFDYRRYLAPGERGTVMLLAQDRRGARVLMWYISALLNNVSLLKPLIVKETTEAIELANGLNIEVHTSNFRAVRGYTIVACLCDEIAWWLTEDSANPDFEVLEAIRPGMATVPEAMLLCLSSPYAQRGALFDVFKRYWGEDGDVLIWRADSRRMNPTISKHTVARAYERDPERAKAEFGAQFRSDIESYVSREAVEACVVPGRYEVPWVPGVLYRAFCDPSGGSKDSMTLAISHQERSGVWMLDCIRERKPPFSPEDVVEEFATLLKDYRIGMASGDRFGGLWPSERFRVHGINYVVSERVKSDLYKEFLPLINSGQVELLDHPKLIQQLINLERRTARGGRDSIDHPPGGHDDVANAAAGAIAGAKVKHIGTFGTRRIGWYGFGGATRARPVQEPPKVTPHPSAGGFVYRIKD